jgi:hypothetical protein
MHKHVNASAMDIRFVPEEDRLLLTLRSDDAAVDLLLTRRLTRLLLGGIVEMLMRSSSDMRRTPVDFRNDVLLFEHMTAATSWERTRTPSADQGAPAETGPEEAPARPVASARVLVTKLDLNIREGGISFVFYDGDVLTGEIAFPRDKVHQFLSVLLERSVDAHWDLQELYWLHKRTHIIIPEGAQLS